MGRLSENIIIHTLFNTIFPNIDASHNYQTHHDNDAISNNYLFTVSFINTNNVKQSRKFPVSCLHVCTCVDVRCLNGADTVQMTIAPFKRVMMEL